MYTKVSGIFTSANINAYFLHKDAFLYLKRFSFAYKTPNQKHPISLLTCTLHKHLSIITTDCWRGK